MNPHPPPTPSTSEAVTPQALRQQYESGATVDELVTASGLSYGTVLNRLHDAGTVMRTSWQTRRMRQNPQARKRLAARLRTLYEQHGATLTELAAAAGETRRGARRLLIEAGGTVRTTQQTQRVRAAARAAERYKVALSLRARYEAGATVPELAKEHSYSVATVYRLLHQAGTPMRPQHSHDPAHDTRERP
ncbi:helix-turn-helix domain-containing protein [Streptomyces sp. AK02-04a]|uniref:helix-turn-helix domain-containing protein n=1 Tax=Streptomyces sp. AK02-04a TaxID=3028649 RepID=UPI0029B80A3B|nr:helix-turn-helix domain containing protein [Streptomyces sp. AK02-04a]MDX3757954.1 helix-turn-helix domain containing protein [Streptomyces sp. AK02-04a]